MFEMLPPSGLHEPPAGFTTRSWLEGTAHTNARASESQNELLEAGYSWRDLKATLTCGWSFTSR